MKNKRDLVEIKGFIGFTLFILTLILVKIATVYKFYSDQPEIIATITMVSIVFSMYLAKDYVIRLFKF